MTLIGYHYNLLHLILILIIEERIIIRTTYIGEMVRYRLT